MMENLRIVLVRPKYPRNIGMVARAMSNYGLKHLILIDPQCTLDNEANEGAANGQEPLQKITIYPHWQRFYDWEHEGIRIAFSARNGKRRKSFDFSETLISDFSLHEEMNTKVTYLIFGPEDHGLADNDLDYVHRVFQMNLPGQNQSLNLSHAVLTALTLIHQHVDVEKKEATKVIEKEKIFFPEQTLRRWLEALNIDITHHQKINAYTVLRTLILKGFPTPKELRMLETVLQQTIRKLKEKPSHKDAEL